MIYIEYNKTEPTTRETELTYTEYNRFSDIPSGSTQISVQLGGAPQPFNSLYPSSTNLKISGWKYGDFRSPKNYKGNKFYFYSSMARTYLYFETNINKGDIIRFDGSKLFKKEIITGKTVLPLFGDLEINKSGLETTFSSITADFNNKAIEDIPFALQEVRIREGIVETENDIENCNIIYTGFIDSVKMADIKTNDDDKYIEFNLMSPMTFTTKRYTSINGTFKASEAIYLIFRDLIKDGFDIRDIIIDDKEITLNYYYETVEEIMNDIASKINCYWFIDENKHIFVYDISKLLLSNPKMSFYQDTGVKGLYSMIPTIQNNDYFNKLIIKNAKVFNDYNIISYDTTSIISLNPICEDNVLTKNEDKQFNVPFDISVSTGKRLQSTYLTTPSKIELFRIAIYYEIATESGGYVGSDIVRIEYDVKNERVDIIPGDYIKKIGFNDDKNADNLDLVLIKDSFFSTLITGINYKKSNSYIDQITGKTFLQDSLMIIKNEEEIEKSKNKISKSGIIEKVISLNDNWYTQNELYDYGKSIMKENQNHTTQVELSLDEDYNLNIGDVIKIQYDDFFIDDNFLITDIIERRSGIEKDYQITAKNFNILENYIDIFRKTTENEEDQKSYVIYERS